MMLKRIALLAAAAAMIGLQGCAGPTVERYAQEKPALDLAQYFQGQTTGWGMVTDRSGEVTRRFVVKIDGRFEGNTGVLDETFEWSDGEKQKRIWRLERLGPNRWKGTADDVVGEATGEIAGNALHWRYTLAVPVKGTVINMAFDDWMVLIDDKVMLNRATFSKFGIRLGEVTLSFQRP
ncbi:MAG: DUF3833 domain-containing protein [Burkholderiaceae bacterium]|jgi:hypothetical protein